jgi:hypothetical protein
MPLTCSSILAHLLNREILLTNRNHNRIPVLHIFQCDLPPGIADSFRGLLGLEGERIQCKEITQKNYKNFASTRAGGLMTEVPQPG